MGLPAASRFVVWDTELKGFGRLLNGSDKKRPLHKALYDSIFQANPRTQIEVRHPSVQGFVIDDIQKADGGFE
jgi:hypothetical protein